MPALSIYQVDAFAEQVFRGNPAAVVPLQHWLPEATLQGIAAENNQAETAFFVRQGGKYHIRWFTPRQEVVLCGHATLASAHVIMQHIDPSLLRVDFSSLSGPLSVTRSPQGYTLDLPRLEFELLPAPPPAIAQALGGTPVEVFRVTVDPNYFAVFASESVVRSLKPNLGLLETLHPFGVVVTARGTSTEIVSRYFAPSYAIPEDPVTGSIHCALAPYWAPKIGRNALTAYQASERGGSMHCELRGDRVLLTGSAVQYLEGRIVIGD
jgi:predicted PhzF superfamily epimerase YddE/YHI9